MTDECLLIRGAEHVLLSETDDDGPFDVQIEKGVIVAIARHLPLPEGARCIDATGHLLAPGFVNAHWHSPMQLSAGTADRLNHKAFMWLNQVDTAQRTSREITVSALLGCIAMLKAGITSVIDHFPEQRFEIADVEAVVNAYRQCGIRAVVALRIFDGAYADILPQPEKMTTELASLLKRHNPLSPRPIAESLALCEDAIRRFDRTENRIRVFPAPSNPVRCSDELLTAVQRIAERHDTGVHCHLLETRTQADIAMKTYGKPMVEHMIAIGAFSHRWSCAHCNWLDDAEIAAMAQVGAVAVFNPESNLKIGSGVPRVPHMLQAGVPAALGTDGVSTNDDLVLQDAMMLAAILHRPTEPDRSKWVTARTALDMATVGGARAMLEPKLGRIAVGYKADLVLYDLQRTHWTPLNNAEQQMVFAERGQSVRTVIVAGRVVIEDGRMVDVDEGAIIAEARDILRQSRSRNAQIARIAELVDAIERG